MRFLERRVRPHVVPAVLAAALGALSAAAAVLVPTPLFFAAAGVVHVLAARLGLAAGLRRRRDLSPVERDLVFWTGLLVPVCGPAAAWALPRPPEREQAENAHRVFESYTEYVRPADPGYERTLFTGDYKRDLARELDAESYASVLRHGATDQKRNALRRLAELGEPKHFDLIRSCLLDPEHEVRLYAYSELERAGRRYEEAIARGARELRRKPDDAEVLLELARTYHAYAASGILDPQMAAFYYRAAERYAGQAIRTGAAGPEAAFVRAAALGRLGAFEEAETCLAELPEPDQERPACCLVRAELAYARRDLRAVRREAERLRAAGGELPRWLAAVEKGARR